MDPQKTNDGRLYGPERYKTIVRQRYYISKNTNISYNDTGDMTPTEREYILGFIVENLKRTKEMLESNKHNNKSVSDVPVYRPDSELPPSKAGGFP